MKKLAMILAVAFTMGLTASTVSASTKDNTKKDKTECTAKAGDTKACCAKAKECTKDAKASCAASKKADTPAPAKQ